MRKLLPLLFLCLVSVWSANAQTFQLFGEDFDDISHQFDLNAGGPVGGFGTNRFIVNDEYDGGGIYPNTISQDSTVFGTITGAPFSSYLHIYDSVGAAGGGPDNANFDPSQASDNFAQMTEAICTRGLSNVNLSFFYLSEGGADDYGELWAETDGVWQQIGLSKYNNTSKWKFDLVNDPVLENVEELRIGFRWVNAGGGAPASTSLSVDDIIVVASYDSTLNPIDINIDFIAPDPICQLDNLVIGWSISDPLCEGVYQVELSSPGGSFSPFDGLGVFVIAADDTSGAIAATIPGTTLADSCYKVRISRVSPLPAVTGEASICFTVEDCPNTITTLQPVVTYDTNAVCVNSVIDVPFFSTGVFITGNQYIAELSDSTGSFASPSVIGTLTTSETFDPALGSPPGTVSGLVPVVPPGCNYMIRVRSTIPATIGSEWGPFCIQECDIETNEIEDIWVCITDTTGATLSVPVDISIFDSTAVYCDSNQFIIEVLETMFFSQVSYGELGVVFDTASSIITMEIPGYLDLLALGLDAGVYYMRINANCSSDPENSLGTLIHLTIGHPADIAPLLIPSDTVVCRSDIASVTITPYNIFSEYQVQFNAAPPFVWPFNPVFINFAGSDLGPLDVRVREINYGCVGAWSETVTITVIDFPGVNINAPDPVCVGDTILFNVSFIDLTFYDWTVSGGTIVDTANNQIRMIFDAPGTYDIDLYALNQCGADSGSISIEVVDKFQIDAGDDRSICVGENVMLNAFQDSILIYEWIANDSIWLGNVAFLDIVLDSTTVFVVTGEDRHECISSDSVTVTVEEPFVVVDSVPICPGETLVLDADYPQAVSFSWWDGNKDQTHEVTSAGTYSMTLETSDFPCPIYRDFIVYDILDVCDPIVDMPNAFSPNADGINDFFTVFGLAIIDYDLSIYNRWGEVVYHTTDVSEVGDPNRGWDGTYQGEPQNIGTYVYVLRVTGASGVKLEKRGNLSLLR